MKDFFEVVGNCVAILVLAVVLWFVGYFIGRGLYALTRPSLPPPSHQTTVSVTDGKGTDYDCRITGRTKDGLEFTCDPVKPR